MALPFGLGALRVMGRPARGGSLILGNTGCNERIQPGFGSSEAIAFEIPEGATPVAVVFWDPQEADDPMGKISLVRFTLAVADFNRTSPK